MNTMSKKVTEKKTCEKSCGVSQEQYDELMKKAALLQQRLKAAESKLAAIVNVLSI